MLQTVKSEFTTALAVASLQGEIGGGQLGRAIILANIYQVRKNMATIE